MSAEERAAIRKAGAEDARRSRARQGLPKRIEDPATVAILAAILHHMPAHPASSKRTSRGPNYQVVAAAVSVAPMTGGWAATGLWEGPVLIDPDPPTYGAVMRLPGCTLTEASTRPPIGITTAVHSPPDGTRSRTGDCL
jgi:hypothetical protein